MQECTKSRTPRAAAIITAVFDCHRSNATTNHPAPKICSAAKDDARAVRNSSAKNSTATKCCRCPFTPGDGKHSMPSFNSQILYPLYNLSSHLRTAYGCDQIRGQRCSNVYRNTSSTTSTRNGRSLPFGMKPFTLSNFFFLSNKLIK